MIEYLADYKYIESQGAKLFTVVLLPGSTGKFPVVIIRNPYVDIYKNNSEKIIEIDGKFYSKIIHRCELYIYDDFTMLVGIEPQDELRIGDIIVDENRQEFSIKAFEMFRYVGEIPEWAFKISSMVIVGQDYSIGNYLAKK